MSEAASPAPDIPAEAAAAPPAENGTPSQGEPVPEPIATATPVNVEAEKKAEEIPSDPATPAKKPAAKVGIEEIWRSSIVLFK
jgi:hypothetical protein